MAGTGVTRIGILVVMAALAAGRGAAAAEHRLEAAQTLYATAAYEDALAALGQIDDPALLDQADEYRALCLLALARDADAERAIEGLVLRHPLPNERLSSLSPKFTAVYRAVRGRVLPALTRASYGAAKASFEARDWASAVRQFDEVRLLVDTADDPAPLRDLSLLASEFRALAAARVAPPAPPTLVPSSVVPAASLSPGATEPVPPAAVAAAAAAGVPPPVPGEGAPTGAAVAPAPVTASFTPAPFTPVPRVYDMADLDVTPPIVVDQALPPWNPPWPLVARRSYAGRVQVIVGEDGTVTGVDVLRQSYRLYDDLLVDKARHWRYEPARKRGHAVRYRRVIDYVLRSPEGTAPAAAQN